MSKFGLSGAVSQQQWPSSESHPGIVSSNSGSRAYQVGAVIGVGAFGEVRECLDASSQERFAVKIVDVSRWSAGLRARIENEARVLRRLHHRFVIRLHRVHEAVPFRGRFCLDCGCSHFAAQHLPRAPYEQVVRLSEAPSPGKKPQGGPDAAHEHAKCKFCAPHGAEQHSRPETRHVTLMVQELAVGGELLSMIKCNGAFEEDVARHYFRQLVFGLKYLHDRGIVHRDIKLENLVLSADFDLKIVDFGLAATLEHQDHEHLFHSGVGSLPYTAPEVKYQRELYQNQGYRGPPADLWSAAVVLYIMLVGKPPFRRPVLKGRAGIKRCRIFARMMDGVYPDAVTDRAKDLLAHLFQVDPGHRYTINEIMAHDWFNGYVRPTEELHSYIMERSTRLWKEADIPKMVQILHSMHAKAKENRRREASGASQQPSLRRRRSNGSSGGATPPAPAPAAANRAAVAAASVVAAAHRIVGESALRRAVQAAAANRRRREEGEQGGGDVSSGDESSDDDETEQEGELTMPLPAFMTREARSAAQVAQRAHEHRQRRSERRKALRRHAAPSRQPAEMIRPTGGAHGGSAGIQARRRHRQGSRGSSGSNASSRGSAGGHGAHGVHLKEDGKDDEHSVTSEAKSDTNEGAPVKDVIPPPPQRAPPPAPGPVSFEASVIEAADIPLPPATTRNVAVESVEGQSSVDAQGAARVAAAQTETRDEDDHISQDEDDGGFAFQRPAKSVPELSDHDSSGPLVEWKVLSERAARLGLQDRSSNDEKQSVGSDAGASGSVISSQCEISCRGPPELLVRHVRQLCVERESLVFSQGECACEVSSDAFRCGVVIQPQGEDREGPHRLVLHKYLGNHEEFVRVVYDLKKRLAPFS